MPRIKEMTYKDKGGPWITMHLGGLVIEVQLEADEATSARGKDMRTSIDYRGEHMRTSIDYRGEHMRTSIDYRGEHMRTSIDYRGEHMRTNKEAST